ncbi:MAG: GNAT family N-acetyltransferase [Bacteroidota bacterium]|jgi:ElaA protein
MDKKVTYWVIKSFEALTTSEIYDILALRDLVFVVEQKCIYLDADGRDRMAYHVMGFDQNDMLVAYCRLFAPGFIYEEASIGRVVTHPSVRGTGLGKELMSLAIDQIERLFHTHKIRISGQLYLKEFYRNLGFEPLGDVYLEDEIEHIAMTRGG